MILGNLGETIKADRLYAGDACGENKRHVNKKTLSKKGGSIARSYPDPRNKVLAQSWRKRDGCNRMNTPLTAVQQRGGTREKGSRELDLEAGLISSGVPGPFSSRKRST
jgi:hypothetical protein